MKSPIKILIALTATILTAPAHAVVINSSGFWDNVVPNNATNLNGVGTSTIRWGQDGGSGQSGYNFTGVGGLDIGALPETEGLGVGFLIGSFTHFNQPIFGTTITGTTLNVALNIVNGAIFNGVFEFDFAHTETPNVSGTCLPGSVTICDDLVSIAGSAGAQLFDFGSLSYQLDIFFVGGSLDFLTGEGLNNVRGLVGVITNVAKVPEPGTLALFGLGLAAMGFTGRRKKT